MVSDYRTVEHDGFEYLMPTRDGPNMLGRRSTQCEAACEALKLFAQKRRVVVQAGGNWGYWPHHLAGMFDTVYTFEPDHVCFSCLVANTKHLPNVVRFQAALGSDRKLVDLHRNEDTTGNQMVQGKGIYPTLRIDDLELTVCDVIYLDIEGCESDALKGATHTIERCRPVVVFERKQRFNELSDESVKLMASHRYRKVGAIGNDMVMRPDA